MQNAQDRLVRYLNDAWAVEKSLRTVFGDFKKELTDGELISLFGELENEAYRHEEALELRIRSFDTEPNGGKNLINQIFAKTLDLLHGAHDDYEKSVTDLMKAYTILQFQSAIYESIRSYAGALGDLETAKLAETNRADSETWAKRLWPNLSRVSGRIPTAA